MEVIVVTGNKVTQDQVDAVIKADKYIKLGEKMTVCHLTLINGYEVIGVAGVVDPSTFDIEIGSTVALENAKQEVWKLMGIILQHQESLDM